MTDIELIKHIKQYGLSDLESRYDIAIKRHKQFPNLVLLKYDQINSPMGVKVVQQCRGIILDENDNWRIVSYPYNKFFNEGEGHAAVIDWTTARVYEKLDGSLMTLYYYHGEWRVASSGLPDASGEVNGFGITFADLFWQVWNKLGYRLPDNKNICYMFEMMTPKNRVVVRQNEEKIVLHGARNLITLKELNPVIEAHQLGWECVPVHPINTLEGALEASKHLDPMNSEGYVVVDSQLNRIKIKSPAYVAMSHLKESVGMSRRQLLEVVRSNESEEFLSYFPEFTKDYYGIKIRFERLVGEMEGFYTAVKDIDDRKTFALKVKDTKYAGAMFAAKFNNLKSMRNYLADMQIKNLEQWLEIEHTENVG